ncbi:hypothetical protein K438DRAFT_1787137 [Mycena galopus ATCC 62051]|nr:hypothetical protein K438DRAFT_1787137 [Mycena galopus ATCC 62051]
MGTSKNKVKKKPKGQRTTWTQKTAKVASSPLPESLLPSAQPLPHRLNLCGPAPPMNNTTLSGNVDESAAAAALMSLGGRHQSSREDSDPHFKDKIDRIFAATVPGVSEDDLGGNHDGGEHSQSSSELSSDSSNSESFSDSDDNETMSASMSMGLFFCLLADLAIQ